MAGHIETVLLSLIFANLAKSLIKFKSNIRHHFGLHGRFLDVKIRNKTIKYFDFSKEQNFKTKFNEGDTKVQCMMIECSRFPNASLKN